MKLRGLVRNFQIHVSVSQLYIPTIGPRQHREAAYDYEYLLSPPITIFVSCACALSSNESLFLSKHGGTSCVVFFLPKTILVHSFSILLANDNVCFSQQEKRCDEKLILLLMRHLQEYSRHHLFIHLLQGHDLPAKERSNQHHFQ
jgi:hypothetical protein